MTRLTQYVVPLVVIAVSAAVSWVAWPREGRAESRPPLPLVQETSRQALDAAETIARDRLAADESDTKAAVRLAEILLRKARVETDAAHATEAERVLKAALARQPGEYSALKMLGAIYLSQHRFAEAAESAKQAMTVNPADAWNYGVLGDAYVELGEYERAFEAFDTMARKRPDAASYARVAYAHELQGRLNEALRHMRVATEATSAHDPEALAWHHSQLGNLLLQLDRVEAAEREFARAEHAFPGHPYGRNGLARVAVARGRYDRALAIYRALMADAPTPELAASIGDLLALTGDEAAARAMFARAETLEREGWTSEEPQPAALARLLAERGLKIGEAVELAEQAARTRSDIHTMDALAWAYFQAGRFDEAHAASVKALRTGTRDRRILCHARAIESAFVGRVPLASSGSGPGAPVDGAQCRFEHRVPERKAE